MNEKMITCVVCPVGCDVRVRGESRRIESVEGHQCGRGEKYARDEFVCPVRVLTTTAAVTHGQAPQVSVRSTAPVPKALLRDCMSVIREACFTAPVKRYDVLVNNILGTGTDIVATGQVGPMK